MIPKCNKRTGNILLPMSQGTQHNHPLVVKNYLAEPLSTYLSMLKGTCRTCKSNTNCPVKKQMVLPFHPPPPPQIMTKGKKQGENKHYISWINRKNTVYYIPLKWNIRHPGTALICFQIASQCPDFFIFSMEQNALAFPTNNFYFKQLEASSV